MSTPRFWKRKRRSVGGPTASGSAAPPAKVQAGVEAVGERAVDLPPVDLPSAKLPPADIEVDALGGTRVRVRGVEVERWRSARGAMVLRYLLLHRNRPVHREVLMELLWPGSSPQAARNNLNVAIYGLRRSLDDAGVGPFIVHRSGSYAFEPSLSIRVDIDEFVERARAARAEASDGDPRRAMALTAQALRLYRGPLFDDDPDGEWYALDRRKLADVHLDLLELDAELHLETGVAAHCIDTCHESLRLDPCRETTHRLLMRAYVAQHRYHLVARQYADCVAVLASELGVGPQPATTNLFSELLARRT